MVPVPSRPFFLLESVFIYFGFLLRFFLLLFLFFAHTVARERAHHNFFCCTVISPVYDFSLTKHKY